MSTSQDDTEPLKSSSLIAGMEDDVVAASILSSLEWIDEPDGKTPSGRSIFDVLDDIEVDDEHSSLDTGVLNRLGALQEELDSLEGLDIKKENKSTEQPGKPIEISEQEMREDHILYPFPVAKPNIDVEAAEPSDADVTNDKDIGMLQSEPMSHTLNIDPEAVCSLEVSGASFSMTWSALQQWNAEAEKAHEEMKRLEEEEMKELNEMKEMKREEEKSQK